MQRRIFIAILVPDAVRERIMALQGRLRKFSWPVHWEAPEKIHLTLHFLGSIRPAELLHMQAVIREVVRLSEYFSLAIENFLILPGFEEPRVITLRVRESQPLQAMHNAITREIQKLGIGVDERRGFTPHLTIGRIKSVRQDLSALLKVSFFAQLHVGSVAIMQSSLDSSGSRYRIVEECRLSSIRTNT